MIDFDENVAKALDRMYQTPDMVEQRRRVMLALAPQPGEHVLDVGSGPGLLLSELANAVGESGRAVGVDPSDSMNAIARARCADREWAELRSGDAVDLPADAGGFDAVVSTQVYEYVADMPRALAEVARVLRPGGRVLILDTDWQSLVWRSCDEARMRRVLAAWDEHLADPNLPQTLGSLLRRAGFTVDSVSAIPIVNPRLTQDTYSYGILGAIQGFVAGRAGITASEAEAWADEQRALAAADEYFFSINRYVFCAHKRAD